MSSELTEILRTEHSSEDGGKEIQLPETVPEMFLATVAGVNAEGVQITLDGESEPMTKRYKLLQTGQTPAAGARVAVLKISGTFVVLGAI